jgi:hypothetical protein
MSRTRKHKLTGAKAFAHSCRNNGTCDYCRSNRTYNELRDKEKAEYEENEFKKGNLDGHEQMV